MKKLTISLFLAITFIISTFSSNIYALQNDVYSAYKNELQWITKNINYNYDKYSDLYLDENPPTYCVFDINKDGIKELCVKYGEFTYGSTYDFYTCEYGKIIHLGSFTTDYIIPCPSLYACDSNGIFIYGGHTGYETLYKISKEGHNIVRHRIFDSYCDYNYHYPKTILEMYNIDDYSGLF